MEITDIRVRKLVTEGRLRAVVSITIDDMLAVHDIKVIEGPQRLFVAMPSRRETNGTYRDIVHPISIAARTKIEDIILDAYSNAVASEEVSAQLEGEQEEADANE